MTDVRRRRSGAAALTVGGGGDPTYPTGCRDGARICEDASSGTAMSSDRHRAIAWVGRDAHVAVEGPARHGRAGRRRRPQLHARASVTMIEVEFAARVGDLRSIRCAFETVARPDVTAPMARRERGARPAPNRGGHGRSARPPRASGRAARGRSPPSSAFQRGGQLGSSKPRWTSIGSRTVRARSASRLRRAGGSRCRRRSAPGPARRPRRRGAMDGLERIGPPVEADPRLVRASPCRRRGRGRRGRASRGCASRAAAPAR